MNKRLTVLTIILSLVAGCSSLVVSKYDSLWGEPRVQNRTVTPADIKERGVPEYYTDIQPILDKRCVVCHACYDAPCQLNLSSYEGLDRGAHKDLLYDGARLIADEPSRLNIDETSTQAWRERKYYPVLNERAQTPEANLQGSVLYQLLKLKKENPLPSTATLEDSFDFRLARDQQCTSIEEFDSFANETPLAGMPYGLKGLSQEEHAIIKHWIEVGSPVLPHPNISPDQQQNIDTWETYFNGPSLKEKLFTRYIYEHLFLANLYLEQASTLEDLKFYKLVRSATPPGQAIKEIATRRPFDSPGESTFFYRLKPVNETIVDKTHMPYALNQERMHRWTDLFLQPDYEVTQLPSYEPESSANPFKTFQDLPAKSRYKFMLDEAEFTIMGFIKGPVCRGQVALNVIEDHFWVYFVDPEVDQMLYQPLKGSERVDHLRLPAAEQSNASPFAMWVRYSGLQEKHLKDKFEFISKKYPPGTEVSLNAIWDGEGSNPNAALTVFRHFDSATVTKGLHGNKPKTAWVINYSLLERIHYLLVAGFDVYGNLGHQLNTRLYMDFLRMEGEATFLVLMPEKEAKQEFLSWYRHSEGKVKDYIQLLQKTGFKLSKLNYQTTDYKSELFDKLRDHLTGVLENKASNIDKKMASLQTLSGAALSLLPETSIIKVVPDDRTEDPVPYTLLVNRGHHNVSSLFLESRYLAPELNTVSVMLGAVGSYPNSFLSIKESELPELIETLQNLTDENSYIDLLNKYGIRRTSDEFWPFVDWIHKWTREKTPVEYGLLDLNRFQNR